MTAETFAPIASSVAILVGEALPWVIFAGLILLLAIYLVGAEEGDIHRPGNVRARVCPRRPQLLGFSCTSQ
jgi:hypothetical protein